MLGEQQPAGFVFENGIIEENSECRYIVFSGGALLSPVDGPWRLMKADEWRWSGLDAERAPFCIGRWNGAPCLAVTVGQQASSDGSWRAINMRALLGGVRDDDFAVVARARSVLEWLRVHRHCGICGVATGLDQEGALVCTDCGMQFWPRVTPCVIVLISRGDECLLARNVNFPRGLFSTIAGFVEPGESLEQTLAREVEEETGVLCKDPRYFGSQAWPFPSQLMLGFHAEYAGGEERPDNIEIAEVGWWRADQLPQVPPPSSISGALIQDWVRRRGA